jgi:hypothetical protein
MYEYTLIQFNESAGAAPNTGPSKLGNHRNGSFNAFSFAKFSSARYREIKIGICASVGRQPLRGLICCFTEQLQEKKQYRINQHAIEYSSTVTADDASRAVVHVS